MMRNHTLHELNVTFRKCEAGKVRSFFDCELTTWLTWRAGLDDAWGLEAAVRSRTVGEDSGARALQLVGEMVTLRTPSPLRSRISARACTLLRVLTVQFRLEEA